MSLLFGVHFFLYFLKLSAGIISYCFEILPTNALRAKRPKNLNSFGIYPVYINIILRAGLQYMPPRVLALWGLKPCGGNKITKYNISRSGKVLVFWLFLFD